MVIKMAIKKPTGNISFYAFNKAEGLLEHHSPYDVLTQFPEGIAEIRWKAILKSLKKGTCVILPSDVSHSLSANEKFKMMSIMIKRKAQLAHQENLFLSIRN